MGEGRVRTADHILVAQLGKIILNVCPGDYRIDTANLAIGPLTATARGGKNASVSIDGKPVRLTLKGCTTPFECQAYGGQGDRRSLDIRADDELQAFATELDRKFLAEGLQLGLKGDRK